MRAGREAALEKMSQRTPPSQAAADRHSMVDAEATGGKPGLDEA